MASPPFPPRSANRLNGWEQTAAAVEAYAADLPHLEAHRAQLVSLSQEGKSLTVQQGTLAASKQEVSRKLQQVMRDGDMLADFLRTGIRQHYGKESEKMTEFDLLPFRGLPTSGKRKAKPDPEPQTSPNPPLPPDVQLTGSPDNVSRTRDHVPGTTVREPFPFVNA